MAGAPLPRSQVPLFQRAAALTRVPVNVLEGIASVESDFGRNIGPSSTGAMGEMQFEPYTAKQFGLNPLNTPQAIVAAGKLLDEYGYQKDPARAIAAYNAGPGNVSAGAGYERMVMEEAKRLGGSSVNQGTASPGGTAAIGPQFSSSTSFSGGQPDPQGAILAALMKPTVSPSGSINLNSNLLSDAARNLESGNFKTPVTATQTISASGGGLGAARAVGSVIHGSDVNPIHGYTLGRSDMGVDANAPVGTPIVAPNDGKVVAYVPNWYKGQPYVAIELTAGPNKGKVMYVAEQISPNIKVGQTVRRGQTVARYAGSGTGIEIGWASPQNPTQTLAQATTGYTEGEQTKAGMSFRQWLNGLGA